jgi:antitoxin VapB
MGLTIPDDGLVRMIRDLAQRKGVTPEQAIRVAVEREAERDPPAPRQRTPDEEQVRVERLTSIARAAQALPIISDMTDDEILGYDEHGIPSR